MYVLALLAGMLTTMTDADTPAANQAPAPIEYIVRINEPQTHYIEVEATYPTDGKPQVEIYMAVWTPGSYMVREYARHVENLVAEDAGGPLKVEKTRKNRWMIETKGNAKIKVKYRVYCREMTVRTNWVDASVAMLNGAPTFLTLADSPARPHDVRLKLPAGWLRSITGLADAPDKQAHHYVAPDYDTLVDSPILAGNPSVYEFEVDGKKHYLVNDGEAGVWDGPRSAHDVEAVVRAHRAFWGQLPYEKYVFFNMLTEAGGGLEHKNSTILMASRWATRTRNAYLGWLNLVSHEFFHTWNVKRLRPVELGPFDYEHENTTRCLWVAEGFTEYYGRLLVRRAGLCTEAEYLAGESMPGSDKIVNDIEVVQTTHGRLVQPLESASFDAWIKYYRPDENSSNTAISYYTKGAVVAWLLDAKIRKATQSKKSLDDMMKLAYQKYSGVKGYTSAEFRELASEVAGTDLKVWFVKALETVDELDYSEMLEVFGLRFKPVEPPKDKAAPVKAWIGLGTKPDGGKLIVAKVPRGTPGFEAGFNVDDEILAIGDFRVRPETWGAKMDHYRPNEKVTVLVSRRDRLVRLDVTFSVEPTNVWVIEPNPEANEAAKASLKAWLGL